MKSHKQRGLSDLTDFILTHQKKSSPLLAELMPFMEVTYLFLAYFLTLSFSSLWQAWGIAHRHRHPPECHLLMKAKVLDDKYGWREMAHVSDLI